MMNGVDGTFSPNKVSTCRVFDWMLGGVHNYTVDQEAGRRLAEAMPGYPRAARLAREGLRRWVREAIGGAGIHQILDLGAGLPTVNNAHEVAAAIAPDTRTVYVDNEPLAVEMGRDLLRDVETATSVQYDVLDVDAVLGDPEVADMLELSQPVLVCMSALTHFWKDDIAHTTIRGYMSRMAPGSWLAVQQAAIPAPDDAALIAGYAAYGSEIDPLIQRDEAGVAALGTAAGLDLLPPGVVEMDRWRPPAGHTPEVRDPAVLTSPNRVWSAVWRKP